MNHRTRATLVATFALVCLDGQARVNDRCVVLVEASPARVDGAAAHAPCPYVIGYRPRVAAGAGLQRVPFVASPANDIGQARVDDERPSKDASSPALDV